MLVWEYWDQEVQEWTDKLSNITSSSLTAT